LRFPAVRKGGHVLLTPWTDRARRRRKRFLTPAQKYEIWVQLLRGEGHNRAAADQAGVDRSTILKLRQVAKQGALDVWPKSKPGAQADNSPDPELVAARAEIAGASEALKEMGVVRLMLVEGKGRWD
jgi:transposase